MSDSQDNSHAWMVWFTEACVFVHTVSSHIFCADAEQHMQIQTKKI